MVIRLKSFLLAAALLTLPLIASAQAPSAGPGSPRYATDAFPGFDRDDEPLEEGRKRPKWFGWFGGPSAETAAGQLDWCAARAGAGDWKAAAKGYDALVRAWPHAEEAVWAQQRLAETLLAHLEYENAFYAYKYLTDYYSSACDFDATVRRMYEAAKLMKEAGKRMLFFRFANTIDVRRAFEAVVLRAPGAEYAPEALMTIASLREDEYEYEKAVEVYESLRNLYPGTPQAKASVAREAKDRLCLLREHAYNRTRCLDTLGFIRMALADGVDAATRAELERARAEATALLEDEAYKAAKFYDSKTRTRRSAISAYEKFLREHPGSSHVEEVRARLTELQQEVR